MIMLQMNAATCQIRYSSIPSIPIIGYGYYFLQILQIHFKLTRVVYMSNKEKKLLSFFTNYLENHFQYKVCTTIKIGRPLLNLSNIKLDIPPMKIVLDSNNYENILWTFVATTTISENTRKIFRENNLNKIANLFQ